jgi:hypothetical protein
MPLTWVEINPGAGPVATREGGLPEAVQGVPNKREDFKHELSQKMTMQAEVCFAGQIRFTKTTSNVERREIFKTA